MPDLSRIVTGGTDRSSEARLFQCTGLVPNRLARPRGVGAKGDEQDLRYR
jgi:hypothetical protein